MRNFSALAGLMAAALIGAGCTDEKDGTDAVASVPATRDTAMIDSIPSCNACSIVVVDSIAIGTVKDPVIPARNPGFLRDSRGNHYLTFNEWANQPILSYDSAGRFRGRVGTYGSGPGEYRMTDAVFVGLGDSLMVYEGAGKIGQVFSPEGKYGRRADAGGGTPFAVSTDSAAHILALKRERFRESAASQYVLRFAQHGQLVDSFPVFAIATGRIRNLSSGAERWTSPELLRSAAYGGTDGTFWTLGATNYRLEQHDRNGAPRKLFGVRIAGEPAPIMNESDMRAAQASKRIVQTEPFVRSRNSRKYLRTERWLDVDSEGLLWIGRQIGAPSWDTINAKGQKLSPDEAPQEETIPREVEDRRYHTVIEVLDPRVGQLLARFELPFQGYRVAAGFVGRVVADDDGFFKPSVYKLELRRQRAPSP